MLVPGWTLNYEMFFYLLFGLGVAAKRPLIVTTSAILGLVAIGLLLSPSNAMASTYTNPLLLEFLAGVMLAKAYQHRNFSRLRIALPVGLAVFILGQVMFTAAIGVTLTAATLIVAGTIAFENNGHVREHRFFKLLGDASYSIYLAHTIVIRLVATIWETLPLSGWWQFVPFMLICFCGSIAGGIATYFWIERPLTRRLRALAS